MTMSGVTMSGTTMPETTVTGTTMPETDDAKETTMADDRTYGDVGTRLLIDNHQVRVWEMTLEPGQKSALHRHEHDYVMVQISGDTVAAEFEPDSGGTWAGHDRIEGPVAAGTAIFAEAGSKEQAVNTGTETFREVIVEVKAPRRSGLLPVQHINLSVRDLDATLPFYTEVLGLFPIARPDFGIPGAWLTTGNGMQIHLIEDGSFQPPPGPHLAFEVDDIDAEVDRIRGLGVEVSDPFGIDGIRQAFFHDPTGNQFELNQPPG